MLVFAVLLGSCGAPPAQNAPASVGTDSAAAPAKRRADLRDDCDVLPGQPLPVPLRVQYTGVARDARCERGVYTIMGGLTHFLGVECKHCHLEPDYAADTHNKQVANWMARELVPRLQKRADAGGESAVWCQDCHAGKPKLLGNPRRRDVAIEWMTTHLVDDFTTMAGKPPKCRDCHGGDLGSAEFRAKVILGDLTGLAPPEAPVTTPLPVAPTPAAAPSAIPDFGGR